MDTNMAPGPVKRSLRMRQPQQAFNRLPTRMAMRTGMATGTGTGTVPMTQKRTAGGSGRFWLATACIALATVF
jgi:hypothetical protein